MKIPGVQARIFGTLWWDQDHHMYGCPIEIIMHTPRWVLTVRPFSDFCQGGDTRGRTDFHGYERVSKWWLRGNTPEAFAMIGRHKCRCRFCVICLNDEECCRMIQSPHEHILARRFVFTRHLWRMHIRRRTRCGFSPEAKAWIEEEA